MKTLKRSVLIGMALFITATISAQNFRYVGAETCKTCHNKPAQGAQYDHWANDPHSQALITLSGEKATEYAKQNGIADASKEEKCLKCHSTFHAVAANQRNGIKADEGVSCEGCHGPGSNYRGPAIMKNRTLAVRQGLILQTEELCVKCHNSENPFFKEFDFKTAFEKTSHPDPTVKR
jgi:nitrate/TMAO reductase-like tetraheme cytochrome c subunit